MEPVERVKRKKVLNDNDIRILNEHTEHRFFGRAKRAQDHTLGSHTPLGDLKFSALALQTSPNRPKLHPLKTFRERV